MGVVTHKIPVRCVEREEARFSVPPGGGSCQDYAGVFLQMVGGYVRELGDGMCSFCQYSSGDEFVWVPCFFFFSYPELLCAC